MFSFVQNISRLYAFILILLSIIIAFASVSVISMVQSHDYDAYIQESLIKQRHYTQTVIQNILIANQTQDQRLRKQHILRAQETLNNLKNQLEQIKNIQNNIQQNTHNLIFIDHKIYDLFQSQLFRKILTSQNQFINQIEAHLSNENTTNTTNSPPNIALEITLFINKLKQTSEDHFAFHKNLLITCIILFIMLIGAEAIIIYRPFSRRLKEKLEALNKEQEIIENKANRLQKSEERINLALLGANIGLFDWDIKNDKVFLSISACQLLNISRPEDDEDFYITINQFKSYISDKDSKIFNKALDEHLSSNKILNLDIRLENHSPNNNVIWLNLSGQAKWDKNNNAYRLAGTLKNISTHKQNKDLKNTFMSGVENSTIAMAIINISNKSQEFIYASPSLLKMLGFEKKQIIRSNMFMLNGPDTKMEHIDRISAILSSDKKGELEITHYRADGTPFLDKVSFIPILDETQSTPIAFVSFHENISDKDINNENNIQRQRKEAIGELIKTIGPETSKLLTELHQNCQKEDLNRINRLIALHASIAGFIDSNASHNKQIAIASAIEAAVHTNKAIFRDTEIFFTNETDKTPHFAFANDTEIRQIVFNLISNASHSYKNAPKAIKINLYNQSVSFVEAEKLGLPKLSQEYIVLEIDDNGCGIKEDIKSKIFDPLYSGWTNITTTGLGLTVTKTILNSWGGNIIINSIENEGTNIKCYIPIFRSQDDLDFMEMSDLLDELNTETTKIYYH
jgi:PAS domain S-box-containing protein